MRLRLRHTPPTVSSAPLSTRARSSGAGCRLAPQGETWDARRRERHRGSYKASLVRLTASPGQRNYDTVASAERTVAAAGLQVNQRGKARLREGIASTMTHRSLIASS